MEIKHVHWSELYMPFNKGLTPLMLHGEEYVETHTRLKGVPGSRSSRYHVIVTYDREYAVAYLSRVLAPLALLKWNDVQKLVSDAVKASKESNK